MRLSRMSVGEAFDLINAEDRRVADAVREARSEIIAAIEAVVGAFRGGGRLVYLGAGTSGRLGVLDAAECPPTFLSDPTMVVGVIAGGPDALIRSIEGAEDRPEDAETEIDRLAVGGTDVVLGIATGGTTPFVHAGLRRAKERGATTVFFACVPKKEVPDEADISIRVLTGPEVLTGSTRMKAGTATKMVLNMISTVAMVRIGKVHENLMVDVNTTANHKLVDRGIRITSSLTGLSREDARSLLQRAGGRVKTALVMHARRTSREEAESMIGAACGNVSELIEGRRGITKMQEDKEVC
jgi:N-acetylmuramic acid 6-phosphate etherase